MGRIIALLLMSVMLCGCPGPNRKVDPYMAAHVAISQASLVLPVAEGIFSQWLYAQSKLDSPEVKRARLGFSRAMTVLYNSIKLAHDGVNIAKQAQEDPDMSKLLYLSDIAWKDLRDFLGELLAGGSPGIIIDVVEEDTEYHVGGGMGPDGPEVRILDMTVSKNPMTSLPKSLLGRLTYN